MDGKTIYVRSEQEQKICFALSSLGVKFRYEEPYEHPLADEMHSQYRPDFSIYFEQDSKTKRIYLEHFGVDEHRLVPTWFAKDKGITYEEANQKYNDGITWKIAAHKKFGTVLLTTSSADFRYSDIQHTLKASLKKVGVPVQEKTDAELYDMVLPPNSKQEKAFIRLVVTFVTLIKSSCKSMHEVLKQAKNVGDERSIFIIKRIFQPVYERYIEELKNCNQIDFTDAILQATEICRSATISLKYSEKAILLQNCIAWAMIGNPYTAFQEATWHFSINSQIISVPQKLIELRRHTVLESLWQACHRNSFSRIRHS